MQPNPQSRQTIERGGLVWKTRTRTRTDDSKQQAKTAFVTGNYQLGIKKKATLTIFAASPGSARQFK